ncbi:MAG: DUF1573 domain-containing protein [Bacteroidales bacterium]|nr:DUF1573 domain-containing protein [Bacteroidales bacterium]MBN2757088.1 DUF1573 domain-containing protein [Bacteroidales bacterium]
MLIKYLFVLLTLAIIISFSCNNGKSIKDKVDVEGNLDNGEPQISFVETDFDFGDILIGEIVSHKFKYRNTGTGKLEIKETIANCGCSKVKVGNNPILAGQESYIEITFDSRGFHGLQIKKVEIITNISKQPVNLIISANVEMSK